MDQPIAIVTQHLCDEMASIIRNFEGIDVEIHRRKDGYYIPEGSLTEAQMSAVRHFICGYISGFFRDVNQVKGFMEELHRELSGDDPSRG